MGKDTQENDISSPEAQIAPKSGGNTAFPILAEQNGAGRAECIQSNKSRDTEDDTFSELEGEIEKLLENVERRTKDLEQQIAGVTRENVRLCGVLESNTQALEDLQVAHVRELQHNEVEKRILKEENHFLKEKNNEVVKRINGLIRRVRALANSGSA